MDVQYDVSIFSYVGGSKIILESYLEQQANTNPEGGRPDQKGLRDTPRIILQSDCLVEEPKLIHR